MKIMIHRWGYIYLWIFLICHGIGHLLMPPFLPTGSIDEYYEQRFRIPQLESAEFKISGLPKEVYWTSNGTVFGRPSSAGEWRVNIQYDSLTQSGSYETVLTIKNISSVGLAKSSTSLEIVFPENLIFEINKQEQIEFRIKNSRQLIEWRFLTLPRGVTEKGRGRLSVKIDKEGFYVLRLEASDSMSNYVQACVTLNVQTSRTSLTQTYALNTIYEPSPAVNRLLEVRQKQTELSKQMKEATSKLGKQNATLKANQQIFNRISNNLIQLQNQATLAGRRIVDTLKSKLIKEQKVREASDILQGAEESFNLALIQQLSNNNLLAQAQVDKARAQETYNKAARDLQNQLQVMKNIEKKLTLKQQDKQVSEKVQLQKKSRYTQVANLLLDKERQLTSLNLQINTLEKQLSLSQQQVTAQQIDLTQQQARYSSLIQNINDTNQKITIISRQINDLNMKLTAVMNQSQKISNVMQKMRQNDLLALQEEIKNNQLSIEAMLFEAVKLWSEINYESSIVRDYVERVKFGGCTGFSGVHAVEGVFTVQDGSLGNQSFKVESGHKVLFGKCTRMPKLKSGDLIVIKGYTTDGVIHANMITAV